MRDVPNNFHSNSTSILVVTGASDGIGREFAIQLAAAGFNILLVARNEAALTSVATEIGVSSRMARTYVAHVLLIATKTAGKVETRIQLVDFAKNDPAALNALKSVVANLDVGVLG